MFCRNCANPMDPNAAVCVKCGVPAGSGNNYCPNCGSPTDPAAAVCTKCGISLAQQNVMAPGQQQKSKMVAGLLGIFLGAFGVHNFYLGYIAKAVIQLVITVVTCGFGAFASSIWGLIEGILILTGKINVDGKGFPLKD